MTSADFQPILEAAISNTGHERYRELCDPSHRDYDPRVRAALIARHHSEAPPSPAAGPLEASSIPVAD